MALVSGPLETFGWIWIGPTMAGLVVREAEGQKGIGRFRGRLLRVATPEGFYKTRTPRQGETIPCLINE